MIHIKSVTDVIKVVALGALVSIATACSSSSSGGGGGGSAGPVTCDGGPGTTVNWTANPETAVNRSGGGYRVYFSKSSGFNPGNSGVCSQDVPWVSGPLAPTTTTINPPSGTWYIRVAAYSALNRPGTSGGSESAASTQTSVVVP